MTLHRKKKYSTKSDIGKLKNALEDVKQLKSQNTKLRALLKRSKERIAELVKMTHPLRKAEIHDNRSKGQRDRLRFPKSM